MKITEAMLDEARTLRRAGLPYRAIAEKVGASHVAIRQRLAAAPVPVPVPVPAPAPAIEPGHEPEVPLETTLDFLRASMRESRQIATEARAVGNLGAAQRASRDLGMLSAVVARLEKQQSAEGDSARYSLADIAAAERSVAERFAAYAERPLLCAHCGRALSAKLATGEPQ